MRSKALAQIYKMHSFAPCSKHAYRSTEPMQAEQRRAAERRLEERRLAEEQRVVAERGRFKAERSCVR